MDDYNWNGNGSSGSGYDRSDDSSNDIFSEISDGNGSINGSLVKHGDSNGTTKVGVVDVGPASKDEEKRKKRVEQIGQEEAWFKRGGKEKLEVNLALQDCLWICILRESMPVLFAL